MSMWLNYMFRQLTYSAGSFSGVSPAPLWKCWPRNLHGPSTKQWQPFLRLPPSLRSPCSPRACPTRAGTSCGRCLWRRSGGPLQTFCSATPSSRAASEARGPPPLPARPPLPRRLPSSPARPVPRTPGPPHHPPATRLQGSASLQLPALPFITSVCLVRTTHQLAQPGFVTERGQVDGVRPPESSEVLWCCSPQEGNHEKALSGLTSYRLLSLHKSRKSDPS